MAEYLHLYNDLNDYDLRGSVYHVAADGWIPATFPAGGDLDEDTVVESLELMVMATTAAGVETAIAALRALLVEASRRDALTRYPHTLTYLKRGPDGAGNADYRYAQVVGGEVRRLSTVGTRTVKAGASEYYAVVVLEVEHRCPHGPAETMENLVPNASFEFDTDDNGLADSWAEAEGTETTTILAVDNDYGAYGQRVVYSGGSADPGVRTGDITVTAETTYCLKAWVDNNNGNAEDVVVKVYDETNAGWISGAELTWEDGETPAIKSTTFDTPASCVAIRVHAVAETATACDFTVDAVYVGEVVDLEPQAWMGYRLIYNHQDGADESTHVNWVHVADVPGEIDAMLENKIWVNSVTGGAFMLVAGRRSGDDVWEPGLWLQAEDGTLAAAASLDTDAGASGPASDNCVDWTIPTSTDYALYWNITDSDLLKAMRGTYRVILFVKRLGGTACNVTFRVRIVSGAGVYSESVTFDSDTYWQLVLGPVISIPVSRPMSLYDEDYMQIALYFEGDSAVEHRFDAVMLVPIDEGMGYLPEDTDLNVGLSAADDYLVMSGMDRQAIIYDDSVSKTYLPRRNEGLLNHLAPGLPQRLYYVFGGQTATNNNYYVFDESFTLELTYRPRYLSL